MKSELDSGPILGSIKYPTRCFEVAGSRGLCFIFGSSPVCHGSLLSVELASTKADRPLFSRRDHLPFESIHNVKFDSFFICPGGQRPVCGSANNLSAEPYSEPSGIDH